LKLFFQLKIYLMKTSNFLKSILAIVAISATSFFTSCDNDDDDMKEVTYKLSGNATGAQEVPAVTTTATASITGTYSATTNLFTYSISWMNLSGNVINAHIHGPAAVGVSAGVLQPLTVTTNGTTGVSSGTLVLSDAEETALLAGNVYYNLHTTANTNGEIRGQIITTPN
jgi:hypothetical protein